MVDRGFFLYKMSTAATTSGGRRWSNGYDLSAKDRGACLQTEADKAASREEQLADAAGRTERTISHFHF